MRNSHTLDDIPSALKRLKMEGVIESNKHEESIVKLVNWALGHPKVKEWFNGEWTLYNECAILYRKDGEVLQTKRPDRVMRKDDEVVVVDFKFGKPNPEYNEQVERYMKLLREMGYKQVRGYLWYVYRNTLEEIK